MRYLLPSALLLASAAAHAVPYTLPTSDARPFAQLQPTGGGATLCATWLNDGACDVEPGTYRLVTYDTSWQGLAEPVTISDASVPSALSVTMVEQQCDTGDFFFDNGVRVVACTASCPTGTIVIATQCRALDTAIRGLGLSTASGGNCIWEDAIPLEGVYSATATCLSR